MNLEFTSDEEDLINEANRIFEDLGARKRGRDPDEGSTWERLVSAGWAEIGAGVEDGTLSLGAVAGIYRAAGRSLLVEQMVTSGYLVSALILHTPEADRGYFSARLSTNPGVLCHDGRSLDLRPGNWGVCASAPRNPLISTGSKPTIMANFAWESLTDRSPAGSLGFLSGRGTSKYRKVLGTTRAPRPR